MHFCLEKLEMHFALKMWRISGLSWNNPECQGWGTTGLVWASPNPGQGSWFVSPLGRVQA